MGSDPRNLLRAMIFGGLVLGAASAVAQDRPGFWVDGRSLYDHLGERVLLRGVNKMNVWTDREGDSFSEIRKAGANTVRIVWAMNGGDWVPSPADLDRVIGRAIENELVPMIELHDATGNWNMLRSLVNYWVHPEIVAVIEKYERHLLVNIGNEVGDWTVTSEQFFDGYSAAVAALRAAGIDTTLVIDAPDYGKNLTVLTETAPSLLDADPNHNLLFSVHLYWPQNFGADAAFIRTHLAAAVAAGYPLVVGEFSRYGAYAGEGVSICSAAGETDYGTILEECDRYEIGWYAWEWGPGNVGGGDPLCTVMDMTTDSTLDGLQAGWATEVVFDSPYGIAATSVIPRSLRDGGEPDPTATSTAPPQATPTPAEPRVCVGDCSGDDDVTVDELVLGIKLAVRSGSADECAAFDPGGDERVTIDEVMAAVNAALYGCASSR